MTVPLNTKGIEEYNYGVQATPNMHEYQLEPAEMERLYIMGIFNYINEKCNLMIDDYESEIITAENIRKCLDELKKCPGTFLDAAQDALKYNTFLALDF